MAEMFDLKLIAPERVLSSRRASMVVLPGAEGQLGILAGHSPLIVLLQPGVVTVEGNGEAEAGTASTVERFFVAGGFAEVAEGATDSQPTQLTILADDAMPLSELQGDSVAAEIASLEGEIEEAETDAARAKLLLALAVAQAKQAALQNPLAA